MAVRLAIEAPAITPSEPTPAIVPAEPAQLAPSEVDSGAERNAQTVTESSIKPETNAKNQESTLETDRETTDRVPETEGPVYDPDRGSEEVRTLPTSDTAVR